MTNGNQRSNETKGQITTQGQITIQGQRKLCRKSLVTLLHLNIINSITENLIITFNISTRWTKKVIIDVFNINMFFPIK